MAGIYLHIPFCKQACSYCNFHFSTQTKHKAAFIQALKQEIQLRQAELQGQSIETIYFGGGTPSLLSLSEIQSIFESLNQAFELHQVKEITLEANPDDLSLDYLQALRDHSPINRLSIGIQSFVERDLQMMKRAHNLQQAHDCLNHAHKMGFHNLNLDLIYHLPELSPQEWEDNINQALSYQPKHLSAYALTIENKTLLDHQVKRQLIAPAPEEKALEQFKFLRQTLQNQGYEAYEISNFSRPHYRAQHNSNYWLGQAYLGLGPSAHSFDGTFKRSWNPANNAQYIKTLSQGRLALSFEILSPKDRFNETLMMGLRTSWGLSYPQLIEQIPKTQQTTWLKKIEQFKQAQWLQEQEETWTLSEEGLFLSDFILSELFLD